MAKPRELYSGAAPQAMSQMGAGIADAYANVGRIEGQGMAAMGEGIAKGIMGAASAIGSYKQMQSQVKSAEGFYKSMKEGGYLPENLSKGIDATVEGEAYKHMGTAEKAEYWGNVRAFTGNAISNQAAMDKMNAEFGYNQVLQGARLGADAANQQARINAGYNQAWVDAQAKASYGTGGGSTMLPGVNPGLFSGIGATPQGVQATQGAMQSNAAPAQAPRPSYNPFNQPRKFNLGF